MSSNSRILTADEQHLRSLGWPHVSTTILGPNARLQPHSHHSANTHYITAGSMRMTKNGEGSGAYIEGDYKEMPANETYWATAGRKGCVFVEGHAELSPETGKRFEAREAEKKKKNNKRGNHC